MKVKLIMNRGARTTPGLIGLIPSKLDIPSLVTFNNYGPYTTLKNEATISKGRGLK